MIADMFLTLWILAIVVALYFLPTMLAFNRNVPSPWSVAAINALLGWTLIGWAVALAMGLRDPKPQATPSGQQIWPPPQ